MTAITRAFVERWESNRFARWLLRSKFEQHYRERDVEWNNDFMRRLERRNFLPEMVNIQISRRCNLRCTMCGWSAWKRNKGFMTEELYRHILSEMKLNNIRQAHITNPQGEPLLHPHAIEFLRIALGQGFEVYVNTNCTTLGDRTIAGLTKLAASQRLHIQASFSGYDKESHESVYVGSKFDATTTKLRSLNEALKAQDLQKFLTVSGVIYNRQDLPKHVEYLIGLGFDRTQISMTLPDNFAGIVNVGKKSRKKGMYSFKSDLHYRSLRLCVMLALYVLIYDDRKVSACACRDSENVMGIGDITKQSLAEIRSSSRYRKMLQAFVQNNLSDMPLCQKCDVPYGDFDNEKLLINGELTKAGRLVLPT
jgi:MoaA/NifB/PqqE/SkfB family radical SAM enzyme